MKSYADMVFKACQNATMPPVPLDLSVEMVELYDFGSECIIAVVGSNLHFCNKLSVQDVEVSGEIHSLSGSTLLINMDDVGDSLPLRILKQGENRKVDIQLHNDFSSNKTITSVFVKVGIYMCMFT